MKHSLFFALVLLPVLVFGQIPKSYLCAYSKNAPIIDGKLSDAAWQAASWTDTFVDIEGNKKPQPRFKTRVKMLWDDSCFYIGAELQEPDVWATIAKRDDVIFYDNDFEVFMDPNGDNFEYGEFEINALNTGWDLFLPKPYKDGGSAVDGWNIDGIQTAVFVNGTINKCWTTTGSERDSGWSVEIAMPWKGLEKISHSAKAPLENSQWRINFSRVEWQTLVNLSGSPFGGYTKKPDAPEDNWVWSPQGVINMHRPEMWGFVQFSKGDSTTAILPDSLGTARRVLHSTYYAEMDYFKAHQKWTAVWGDLPLMHLSTIPQIMLTDSGYTASLEWKGQTAHIRQDSYFWVESVQKK
jgi:hypothetical protein